MTHVGRYAYTGNMFSPWPHQCVSKVLQDSRLIAILVCLLRLFMSFYVFSSSEIVQSCSIHSADLGSVELRLEASPLGEG